MDRKGFSNMLVPLDGAQLAEQAVSVAASLARRSGAVLRLASVEQPLPALVLSPEAPGAAIEAEQDVRAEVADYLESTAQAIRDVQGGTIQTSVLQGPVNRALEGYAESEKIDLIVMTTRGRGGLSRWFIGSVADQLLRHTRVPVLLLHPRELPQPTEFRRILIALDGEMEDEVLDPAIALGSLHPAAQYSLTRVVEPPIPILTPLASYPSRPGPHYTERLVSEARQYLTGVCQKLEARGIEATYRVLVGRGVAEQLLELAGAVGADCIVVGTHRRRGAERMVLGSVADRIVRGAEVPVLIGPTQRARVVTS
jgi:nucleotide-binding universal stress UspA family protein